MATVYIGLGSNLQDRLEYMNKGVIMLNEHPDISITALSSIYETDPVGGPLQGRYLNAVAQLETELTPEDLLKEVKDIEYRLGRRKNEHWGPRFIDLDILTYEGVTLKSEKLNLPHLLLAERWFVLIPLNDLAPNLIPPGFNQPVSSLLDRLGKPEGIDRLNIENPWKLNIGQK